ncbi:MAG: hypothetical protein ACKOAD_02330 [Gammaproteobacteria bacterium]
MAIHGIPNNRQVVPTQAPQALARPEAAAVSPLSKNKVGACGAVEAPEVPISRLGPITNRSRGAIEQYQAQDLNPGATESLLRYFGIDIHV